VGRLLAYLLLVDAATRRLALKADFSRGRGNRQLSCAVWVWEMRVMIGGLLGDVDLE